MEKANQKLEAKLIFWAVLGPFITILTLFVSVTKASAYALPLSFVALIAIPICWRWRMQGLLLSVAALTVVFLYTLGQIPLQHRFWQTGLAMAFGLALVVTALAFEEVAALVSQLRRELQGRLDSLWRLDEKVKNVQERWQYDREDFAVRLKLLTEELEEKQRITDSREEAAYAARAELERAATDYQRQQELLLREQQLTAALKADLAELRDEMQGVSQAEVRTSSPADQSRIRELESDLREREATLDEMRRNCRSLMEERDNLQGELSAAKERVSTSTEAPDSSLAEEKDRELKRIQGLYRQLREQFEEKDRVLHQTRVNLFQKEGEYLELERKYQEASKEGFASAERDLALALEKSESDRLAKEGEIEALNDLVSSLMGQMQG